MAIVDLTDKTGPAWVNKTTVRLTHRECDVDHCPNSFTIEWYETDCGFDEVEEVGRFTHRPKMGFFTGEFDITCHYKNIGYAIMFHRHKHERECKVQHVFLFKEEARQSLREHLSS